MDEAVYAEPSPRGDDQCAQAFGSACLCMHCFRQGSGSKVILDGGFGGDVGEGIIERSQP